MAARRSRRLDAPVDQLTVHHIVALIDNGVHEDFDLDFKRETVGNSESAKRELAADVAASADMHLHRFPMLPSLFPAQGVGAGFGHLRQRAALDGLLKPAGAVVS
ncbi:hypothetical protein [Micromonospora ureilytica]|uniref:hypothetical protein n=1 Tax=Micromonospora ureilytica TaxID=709868 RepID=UPI0040395438